MASNRVNLIIGILNLTPDSFSDGGFFAAPASAVSRARELLAQGCDLIDIGAESSRPGADPVDAASEWARLEPVLNELVEEGLGPRISVDTYKDDVMIKAALLGVGTINCIRGANISDQTLRALAGMNVNFIAMHMNGEPRSMQANPLTRASALASVEEFYASTKSRLLAMGFAPDRIWLDPGIGFGKDDEANVGLIRQSLQMAENYPIVLGVSRKSLLGRTLGIAVPSERDDATKMLELGIMCSGVKAIRTHDVRRLRHLRDLLGSIA